MCASHVGRSLSFGGAESDEAVASFMTTSGSVCSSTLSSSLEALCPPSSVPVLDEVGERATALEVGSKGTKIWTAAGEKLIAGSLLPISVRPSDTETG